MAPAVLEQERIEKPTEEQKKMILEAYAESLHDEGIDAAAAIKEIRIAHGL